MSHLKSSTTNSADSPHCLAWSKNTRPKRGTADTTLDVALSPALLKSSLAIATPNQVVVVSRLWVLPTPWAALYFFRRYFTSSGGSITGLSGTIHTAPNFFAPVIRPVCNK